MHLEAKKSHPVGEEDTPALSASQALLWSKGSTSDALAAILRANTDRRWRHQNGVYFTGDELAATLWSSHLQELSEKSVVYDPACGGASLLMPALLALARQNGRELLQKQVRGFDIQPAFVRLSQARLAQAPGIQALADSWNIQPADFLNDDISLSEATHVVMNPPFSNVDVVNNGWASGKTNAAAIFVMRALELMPEGAVLLAVLPDVLRSGTRYERWRREVHSRSEISSVEVADVFDKHTDVHVFILRLKKRRPSANAERHTGAWQTTPGQHDNIRTLDSIFNVSVGSVVPHRHAEEGPLMPYLDLSQIRGLPELTRVGGRRRFGGRSHQGPFVAVRRTSRPEEAPRLKMTLIRDRSLIAVENHIIVLKPRDGSVATCRRFLEYLRSAPVDLHLNKSIRLRHLTVGSVKKIPMEDRG